VSSAPTILLSTLPRSILRGAAAGAAGTTALNAVTYLDMAVRGRAASSTPSTTVEQLAGRAHLAVPGEGETRDNRVEALGALSGLVTGIGVGALLGLARGAGWRPGPVAGALTATAVALVIANGPMTALGVTDPRTWSGVDWASDLVPHVGYGVVTGAVLAGLDDGR
jgi:hypothetical protein